MAGQQTDWVDGLAALENQGGSIQDSFSRKSRPGLPTTPPQGFYAYLAWLKHSELAQLQAEKSQLLQRQAADLSRADRQQVMLWLSVVEAELRMRDFTADTGRSHGNR